MKPLPLVWDGRPVPPSPPPYQAPPGPEVAPLAPDAPAAPPGTAHEELARLYAELDAEIARLAPRCDGRGVCCDFGVVDHVLYASSLELSYVMDHLPRERWGRDAGQRCPLLQDGRCGAREVRMLGCRTYFCQDGWEAHGNALYERYYARIQEIARRHGVEWRYVQVLRAFREEPETNSS